MMRVVWIVAAACALASCAGGASSNHAGLDRPPSAVLSGDALFFVEADQDRDRRTTRAELNATLDAAFPAADSDGDGALSPLEWQAFSRTALGGELIGPFRLDMDRNVDNTITRAEFNEEFAARFQRYDRNEDGAVEREELVRALDTGRDALRERPRPPSQAGQPPR